MASDVSRGRRHSLANLARMGHCAPTVARTLLDLAGRDDTWLVKAAAGLPGGIAATGLECGAVTAPVLVLGLRLGGAVRGGLPAVVDAGHAYCDRFLRCNGSLRCSAIRGTARLPLACVRAVRRAPELHAEVLADGGRSAIPARRREAYRQAHAHLEGEGFHCAHAVLRDLGGALPVTPELLDATAGFVGGTVFMGMTCGALAAGVMAVGLGTATLEDSRLRVARMIATLVAGGDAFHDELNAFNRTMNLGHRMAGWFEAEFGSTLCRQITGCDFSTLAGVNRYREDRWVVRCRAIARAVATKVRAVLAGAEPSWAA